MQAVFHINDQRLLLEASPGELFVPLGPRLTECVCAVRARAAGHQVQHDQANTSRLNPDAFLPVVVIACRVHPGEPEYYPPGFTTELQGACPIVFLQPTHPLMLAPREQRGMPLRSHPAEALAAHAAVRAADHADLSRPELASQL